MAGNPQDLAPTSDWVSQEPARNDSFGESVRSLTLAAQMQSDQSSAARPVDIHSAKKRTVHRKLFLLLIVSTSVL